MTKARMLALVIIAITLLSVVMPQVAVGEYSTSEKPVNTSPYDGATEINPSETFRIALSENLTNTGVLTYAHWRFIEEGGDWAHPLYDSGQVLQSGSSDNVELAYPAGYFAYGKTYSWQAKVRDEVGNWSDWSDATSFTVVVNSPPCQPENLEPDDGATGISLPVTLEASGFLDPNAAEYVLGETDTHAASQWQMTRTKGDYSDAQKVLDTGAATDVLTQVSVYGLQSDITYYWRVRYQDSYGNWSAYSSETSFKTGTIEAEAAPTASFFADKTQVVAGADLITFTDNSTGAITAWFWDFGDGVTENWTEATAPLDREVEHVYSKKATDGKPYTVKLTVENSVGSDPMIRTEYITVYARPQALFSGAVAAKAGEEVIFEDHSTGDGITSWVWDFGDGTAAEKWDTRPTDGRIDHKFKKAGSYVVSLTVSGDLLPTGNTFNKTITVTGGEAFHFQLWMILVGVAVVVVLAGIVYLVQARLTKK